MKPRDDGLIPAAVLVVLVNHPDGMRIVFTRRTMTVATHRGQISFPGGVAEAEDESPVGTALREASEEIGLNPADVRVVDRLSEVRTHTGFAVTPVVGVLEKPTVFTPQPAEVDKVFEVSLSSLRDLDNLEVRDIPVDGDVFTDYRYQTGEGVIWGITGRILFELLSRLRQIAPDAQ